MSDSISRKWLMECVDEGWIKFDTEKDKNIYVHLVRDIAPPAQPEPHWIPCSERLPEKAGAYLVQALMNGDIFVARWEGCYWGVKTPVVAWMPLPEAYQGGEK